MIRALEEAVGTGNARFLVGFVAVTLLCLAIMAGILIWEKIRGRI